VVAVDIARFLALAGMMVVHLSPAHDGIPPLSDLIAGGRSAALFAFLAGVSLALLRRKSMRGTGSGRSIAIRAGLIFLLGLLLGSMSEIGAWVILPFYGAMFLLAIPLSLLRARTLLWLAAAWSVVAPVLSFLIRALTGLRGSSQVEISDLASPLILVEELFIQGPYPVITWITFLAVGLAVGQMPLASRSVATRLCWTGAAIVAGTFLLGYVFMLTGIVDGWMQSPAWLTLFVSAPWIPTDTFANLALLGTHTNTPLNIISSVGSSLLVFGLCLLLTRVARPALTAVLRPFASAGRMTLTLYTVHLLLLWVAGNWGFTFVGGSFAEWGVQLLIVVLIATVWLSRFKRGPLESVIHMLSHRAGPRIESIEPERMTRVRR
jgi:uncharacterized protein